MRRRHSVKGSGTKAEPIVISSHRSMPRKWRHNKRGTLVYESDATEFTEGERIEHGVGDSGGDSRESGGGRAEGRGGVVNEASSGRGAVGDLDDGLLPVWERQFLELGRCIRGQSLVIRETRQKLEGVELSVAVRALFLKHGVEAVFGVVGEEAKTARSARKQLVERGACFGKPEGADKEEFLSRVRELVLARCIHNLPFTKQSLELQQQLIDQVASEFQKTVTNRDYIRKKLCRCQRSRKHEVTKCLKTAAAQVRDNGKYDRPLKPWNVATHRWDGFVQENVQDLAQHNGVWPVPQQMATVEAKKAKHGTAKTNRFGRGGLEGFKRRFFAKWGETPTAEDIEYARKNGGDKLHSVCRAALAGAASETGERGTPARDTAPIANPSSPVVGEGQRVVAGHQSVLDAREAVAGDKSAGPGQERTARVAVEHQPVVNSAAVAESARPDPEPKAAGPARRFVTSLLVNEGINPATIIMVPDFQMSPGHPHTRRIMRKLTRKSPAPAAKDDIAAGSGEHRDHVRENPKAKRKLDTGGETNARMDKARGKSAKRAKAVKPSIPLSRYV